MHGIYADTHFDDLDLDARTQWIGRGNQHLSYGIQIAHDGRFMRDIYAHACFDDLDLDIENVCKTRPTCYLFFSSFLVFDFQSPSPTPFFCNTYRCKPHLYRVTSLNLPSPNKTLVTAKTHHLC